MVAAIAIKERPIIMCADMVRATLEDRKTQTRRVVKPQPSQKVWNLPSYDGDWVWAYRTQPHIMTVSNKKNGPDGYLSECPYGKPGDRLWVRESWQHGPDDSYWYRATDDAPGGCYAKLWKPSIHMPRVASRITLIITDVRVERLQDITEKDAIAEGIRQSERTGGYVPGNCSYARWAFEQLWVAINGDGSWARNPWVWVVAFKRLEAADA